MRSRTAEEVDDLNDRVTAVLDIDLDDDVTYQRVHGHVNALLNQSCTPAEFCKRVGIEVEP